MRSHECSFVATVADERLATDLRARARRLSAFYDPVGLEPFDLRELGPGIIAAGYLEASMRTDEFGPQALYVAEGDGVTVVSTHAVAAGVLAGLPLEIDVRAVAQFIALDFAGGDRTLLSGVRALDPGSTVALNADGSATIKTLELGSRWSTVPAAAAYEFTERAVLDWIAANTEDRLVALPLTAGLDSTVVAAALSELGRPTRAFTWGEANWPDAAGAAATAAMLGIEHDVLADLARDGSECLRLLDRDARWGDGVARLAPNERVWPDYGDVLAAGMGGEIGRAFYYDAWATRYAPDPTPERLTRQVLGFAQPQHFDAEVASGLKADIRSWVEAALGSGGKGWNALDVLYADQRVRRWGRSQLPRFSHDFLPCFTGSDVARGLSSQVLDDRLTDAFQRRFIAARNMPVAPPPELPRVSPLQRMARGLRRRGPAPIGDDDPVDSFIPWVWSERVEATDWLRDVVLRHPVVTAVLGDEGARAAQTAFEHGRARSTERVMRAAGVVALCKALKELG